jgi:hypothetical protein
LKSQFFAGASRRLNSQLRVRLGRPIELAGHRGCSIGSQITSVVAPAGALGRTRNRPQPWAIGTVNVQAHSISAKLCRSPAEPNQSLKLSPNGRPPGPGWWYAVHFHQPGPGVLPSVPA